MFFWDVNGIHIISHANKVRVYRVCAANILHRRKTKYRRKEQPTCKPIKRSVNVAGCRFRRSPCSASSRTAASIPNTASGVTRTGSIPIRPKSRCSISCSRTCRIPTGCRTKRAARCTTGIFPRSGTGNKHRHSPKDRGGSE